MKSWKIIVSFLTVLAAFALSFKAALAQDDQWPRTIRHYSGELTLKSKPVRIVSTAPSLTGILLAINAPVIASTATTPSMLTDDKGFFSQWAKVADERGVEVLYSNLDFDIEAIIALEPDLVVASATGADSVLQHYPELKAQGIPTMVVNYSNQSWQDIAAEFGKATGLEDEVVAAVARFNDYAAKAAATIARSEAPVSIVGYNIGNSYSIGKEASAQGQLLEALGFKVDGLPEALARQVTRSSDFDFISHENLSAAITGNTVFLLRGVDADVTAFLNDPVLANLPAVKNKQVYPLGATSFRIDYYSGIQLIDIVAAHFRK
ncbi:Fe2+-enterobactin ABC transporter substrate-binding protein [Brucella pituitosa]|uniref:Fe2+-enterobactin ABC transporter substrate-binding protein n=1 Tax=Brucella pituitosa TaxID=571256 RepID=A0ABS3K3W4_9HYPH|nr:Fe2+-enterobactin ABC transporter substrate-binding protein [Brucella pituitosa]MBO1041606.1 Fe2+-enterobactin ABC transporter substrate-binding protein [Brucella pituitosa]